jgi:hypothetical protein
MSESSRGRREGDWRERERKGTGGRETGRETGRGRTGGERENDEEERTVTNRGTFSVPLRRRMGLLLHCIL